MAPLCLRPASPVGRWCGVASGQWAGEGERCPSPKGVASGEWPPPGLEVICDTGHGVPLK
jgi:hypothetical protein